MKRYKGSETKFTHKGQSYKIVSISGQYELFIEEPRINCYKKLDYVYRRIATGNSKGELIALVKEW